MAALIPTFHAIQLRMRLFVAAQVGSAYGIVSVLLVSTYAAIIVLLSLLADPALIDRGLLLAIARISVLIP